MLQQFNLYIIIVLIVLLLTVSGGFFAYHRIASADIALLEQQTVTYRLAVDEQTRTIETILADAAKLATANKALSERMLHTETEFAAEWSAINELDLMSGGSLDDMETRANDVFGKSIDQLQKATSR
ncbi:hypothetical protein [Rhizobium sp. Root482]|uniref:hypothetical protein n=1 Tax=Rhizobium sp. Root482 TaxID=1736543 RepID=UPI0006FDEBA0|nr:hypothetical protein [Rhizobium sp. Root482]KQY14412.1 hypothetical protein ASD31_09085 [Rhizobium sp. Root482]